MPWSRPFDEPIQPPKGKKLVTLKDAADYIMALSKAKQQAPEWQRHVASEGCELSTFQKVIYFILDSLGMRPFPRSSSASEINQNVRRRIRTVPVRNLVEFFHSSDIFFRRPVDGAPVRSNIRRDIL